MTITSVSTVKMKRNGGGGGGWISLSDPTLKSTISSEAVPFFIKQCGMFEQMS